MIWGDGMPKGQIIRTLSNFYYVKDNEDVIWECKARGLFKKQKISPLVGDYVTFDSVDQMGPKTGYIIEIKNRKNELFRPPIANVDQAVLVFSTKSPDFSTMLLDKFLVHVEKANIEPIICLTKSDLVEDEKEIERFLEPYRATGYSIIRTSAKKDKGLEELQLLLKDKITVFAGQSGVGKSSLLNALIPTLDLETNEISEKLGRGKHTTRFVQFLTLPNGGMVADTPGFSQLDFVGIAAEELDDYFVEFASYSSQCKYRGCLHHNEPGCAVKLAVEENEIDNGRYDHYVQFLKIIQDAEARKWR